jgi:hypothetical protein
MDRSTSRPPNNVHTIDGYDIITDEYDCFIDGGDHDDDFSEYDFVFVGHDRVLK